VRDFDIVGAVGDLLDGGGDDGKRPRDRAEDDQDAGADQNQLQDTETRQEKRQLTIGLGLKGDPLAAFGIDPGERFKILVERDAYLTIGIIVAPFAACGGTDLDSAANELLAECDELFDAFLEEGELLGVICLDDGFPAIDDDNKLVVEFEESIAILLHADSFRRHVDAAGFHHNRIDQRIDVLDVERRTAGSPDRFGEFDAAAGIEIG
jgi:hypothetical protein